MKLGPKFNTEPFADWLEKRIERIPFSGCWVWMGALAGCGYGVAQKNGERFYVHRKSLEESSGQVGGFFSLHRCDVPSCVNPEHLFKGTAADNSSDMMSKGRHVTNAKLTRDQVLNIRRSKNSESELGKEYGVSPSTIGAIKRRNNWSWL